MRVAVVAGPDPGHAFPAIALAGALTRAGHEAAVVTGGGWLPAVRRAGLVGAELPLLAPTPGDGDAGYRLWARAAQMAPPLARLLATMALDLVVADTLTCCGGYAAALLGLPWAELVPHPLADPSRALPPFGTGWRPHRARDPLARLLTRRSAAAGAAQRAAATVMVGLACDPVPRVRLVATLPALEPPRPDWPDRTHVVGPLEWDPATTLLSPPPGSGPLVLLSGSTAASGTPGLAEEALASLGGLGVRLAITQLNPWGAALPRWAVAGPGRQYPLLDQAAAVVCGGGHGMLAKALARGIPVVAVPGGGDQKEIAARAARLGAGVVVRPGRLAAGLLRVLDDPAFARAALEVAGWRSEVDPVAALVGAAEVGTAGVGAAGVGAAGAGTG
ncbi:MAG: glycosyltransferase [Mycobacteriales bacterium]